jgi:hypothetical protein
MTDVIAFRPPAVAPVIPLAYVQGTLALDFEPRREPPPAPVIPIDRSGLTAGRAGGDIEAWARRYVQAAVEIVGGDRPITQLLRWSAPEVYNDLEYRAHLVARAGRHHPGTGRVQPVRPQVRGVRTLAIADGIVEVSALLRYGERHRAIAARFERIRGHWRCTALEFA